jgi:hypothetical protein
VQQWIGTERRRIAQVATQQSCDMINILHQQWPIETKLVPHDIDLCLSCGRASDHRRLVPWDRLEDDEQHRDHGQNGDRDERKAPEKQPDQAVA